MSSRPGGITAADVLRAIRSRKPALQRRPDELPAIVANALLAGGLEWRDVEDDFLRGQALPLRYDRQLEAPGATVAIAAERVTVCAVRWDFLVAGTVDGTLLTWDAPLTDMGRTVAQTDAHAAPITLLEFTGANEVLLSGDHDGTVSLWSPSPVGRTRYQSFTGHGSAVTAALLSPAQQVVAGAEDGTIHIWNRESGARLWHLAGHTSAIAALALSLDSNHLVSGSHDGTLRVWELASGRSLATLRGHAGGVTGCGLVPGRGAAVDALRVVSASADGLLKLWTLDGVDSATLGGHEGAISDLAIIPSSGDAATLALTASHDGSVRLWDLDAGRELRAMRGTGAPVIRVLPLGDYPRRALSLAADGTCCLWLLDSGGLLQEFRANRSAARRLSVSPAGNMAAFVTTAGELVRLDLRAESSGDHTIAPRLALDSDGDRVFVSAGFNRTVTSRSSTGQTVLRDQTGSAVLAVAVPWSADFFLTLHAGGRLVHRNWTSESKSEVTIPGDWTALAVDAAGTMLVTADVDGGVVVWTYSPTQITAQPRLGGNAVRVNTCACSSNAARIVAGAADGTLVRWDRDTAGGAARLTLRAHEHPVLDCDIALDGSVVLSASADGSLKVWDGDTGVLRHQLLGHDAAVTACSITQRMDRAVSCSLDGTLKLWDLVEGHCLATYYGDAPFATLAVASNTPLAAAAEQSGRTIVLAIHDEHLEPNAAA